MAAPPRGYIPASDEIIINMIYDKNLSLFYKDYAFRGFSDPSVSRFILRMPTFRELCSSLHQGEEQPDTELFLRVVPLFLYIMLLVGVKEENVDEEWGGGENRSVLFKGE